MSAYEIGTKVVIDRTHEEGVISGVGQMDWGSSTGGVYAIDIGDGPQEVKLVYEEDLTLPDEEQDVALTIKVTAIVKAETAAIARDRLIERLADPVNAMTTSVVEQDRHEEVGYLKIEIVR